MLGIDWKWFVSILYTILQSFSSIGWSLGHFHNILEISDKIETLAIINRTGKFPV